MQKFTRPLTREIEVAGERLAMTLSDQGINVRPVGSRKPPWEFSWATVLSHLLGPSAVASSLPPTAEQVVAMIAILKKGQAAEPAATTAPPEESAPLVPPVAREPPAASQVATVAVPPAQDAGLPPG